MEENIITVKRNKATLSRDRWGRAVVKISPEAADIVESFIEKSDVSILQLVSSMIEFAAPQTMIREEGEE